MNPPHSYRLVDGTFTPADARQVLLSLVNSKIAFHNREKVSSEERFGGDVKQSERRLAELQQLHQSLRALCDGAAESGQHLQVSGWLEVRVVSDVPAPSPVG